MASASWLESLSRSKLLFVSNLCHSQLRTSHDERSQFHCSRDTFPTVSPSSDHIELVSHRDSMLCHGSQSKTAGWGPTASDYWAHFHECLFWWTNRFQLCCLNSVSPSAAPADLTIPVFQLGIVRKPHKHSLHIAILSGPLFVEGHVDAIVTPELGFVQVVIATCNPRSPSLHLVWFSLMMTMRRSTCATVSRPYRSFNISISCTRVYCAQRNHVLFFYTRHWWHDHQFTTITQLKHFWSSLSWSVQFV